VFIFIIVIRFKSSQTIFFTISNSKCLPKPYLFFYIITVYCLFFLFLCFSSLFIQFFCVLEVE
jgi:hypothetical protein